MTVDGVRNTVYEVDTEAVAPGPGNPLGNAFSKETAIKNLPIPLHPGAARYYKEIGLLK